MQVLTETIARHGYDSFTPGERLYFSIWWFIVETNGGGLHQFLFNDAGGYAADVLESLERIDATQTAHILRRAMAIFPEGRVPTDIQERREVLCDLPDELQWDLLGELNTELFRGPEPIVERVEDYIRQHPDEFARFQQLHDVP